MLQNDPHQCIPDNVNVCASQPDRIVQEAWLKTGALQDAIHSSSYAHRFSIATDVKGVIQLFNTGASCMLGYTAAEVVNKLQIENIFDSKQLLDNAVQIKFDIHSAQARGLNSLIFNASRGEQVMYDLRKVRKDGTHFPAIGSVEALRDAENSIIGYLFCGQDNTNYRKTELEQAQALVDSEQNAQRILDTASDAFVAMNAKGEISEWNIQAQRLFGWTREEVIGKILSETIIPPSLRAGHERGLKHYLATGEGPVLNRTIEVNGVHRDGRHMVIELSVWVVKTREGYGFNSFMHDLTERKEAEKRKLSELSLLAKNMELEHSSQMKSEFLATMSHELRTPLNAIIGFSEALKDGLVGPVSSIQKEYLGDIFSSGEHLLSLINDILDLSKVEAGMMTLNLEPVNLKFLLTNSLTIVRERAIAQRIKLEIDLAEDLDLAQLDLRKTKQIIYNLLSNAVKFTPYGGLVSLRAKRVLRCDVGILPGLWPVHCFALAPSNHKEFLEISVADTGIGISSESMKKLFLAFSQIDSKLSRKFEGTGLGLAMVKQLAELHGGSVAVASQEKAGSQFVAWLPL